MTSLKDRKARPLKGRGSQPSLRPPTLMIDLLFGALMLFAFQMGNPNSQKVVPHKIELPTGDAKPSGKTADIFPLVPQRLKGSIWVYETEDGKRLTAVQVFEKVKQRKSTPILMLSKAVSVQSYIDAETPLRKLGLQVGLAVTHEQGKNK